MNRIRIDEKTKILFEQIRNGEYEERETVKYKKDKKEKIATKQKHVTCSVACTIEKVYMYEKVLEKNERWNSDTNGLKKDDFVCLYNMRQNDPNMFDREAMK